MESFKDAIDYMNSLPTTQTIKISYLYLIITTCILVVIYLTNIDQLIGLNENTALEYFFDNFDSILSVGCVISVFLCIVIGIDLILDYLYTWKTTITVEIDDHRYRLITVTTLLMSSLLILGYINCTCLPILFCLLSAVEILIISNLTFSSCHMLYPNSLDAVSLHAINLSYSLAAITMMLSYGQKWYALMHLLTCALVVFSVYYQWSSFIRIWNELQLWHKNFTDLDTKQVYIVTYLSNYAFFISIPQFILALFPWVELGFLPCVTIFSCLLAYSVCVILIPGRVARTSSIHKEHILHFKRKMIRYLSHEIRSPLNVVNSTLSLSILDLRKNAVGNENLLDSFEDMKHACSSAICILDDMLNIESMDAGTFKLDKELLIYFTTIEDIVDSNRIYALQKGIELIIKDEQQYDINDDDSIDHNTRKNYIYVDKFKIEQLIRNLIVNAVKFTNTGGNITVTIRTTRSQLFKTTKPVAVTRTASSSYLENMMPLGIQNLKNQSQEYLSTQAASAKTQGDIIHSLSTNAKSNGFELNLTRNALIEITDTGVGIDPSDLHKMFQEFSQMDARELQGGGGSGLGLWICKEIIKEHQGQISCHSKGKNMGCTFSITLPMYYKPINGESNGSVAVTTATTIISPMILNTYGKVGGHNEKIPLLNEVMASRKDIPSIPVDFPPQKHRILVVDDSVINRKIVIKILHHIAEDSKHINNLSSSASSVLAAAPHTMNTSSTTTLLPGNSHPILSSTLSPSSSLSSLENTSSYQHLHQSQPPNSSYNSSVIPVCFEITEADDGITAVEEIIANLQGFQNAKAAAITNDSNSLNTTGNIHQRFSNNNNYTNNNESYSNSMSVSPYSAILIDNIMVRMHGPEATKRIRALGYKGIIVAITGNVMAEDVSDFLNNGADYVMKKPISITELKEILSRTYYHN